jgi:hypothetical protein
MRAWIDRHLHWTAFIVVAIASNLVLYPGQDPNAAMYGMYFLVYAPIALWLGYKKRRSKWYIPALILLPLLGFVLENKNTK